MIHKSECVVCHSGKLTKVLDLGIVPSSNNLVLKEELGSVKRYPLVYYICENCGMFQLLDIADSRELFDNYLYFTGANKELVSHFHDFAEGVASKLQKKDLAVVVGSNDGTEVQLLKDVAKFNAAIGVDPAKNIAQIAIAKGITTINDFFGYELSKKIVDKYGKADLITASNVFAHIPDPKDMLLGMKNLLKDDGLVVIEVHWLKSIVEQLEIETLYTEHYYVWSVKAMENLVKQCGMHMTDVEYMPEQHGGSLRFFLKSEGTDDLRLMEDERRAGLYDPAVMNNLQKRADARKEGLVNLIRSLKSKGNVISIWSVPAKIPTLLNFCGLTSKDITYAYEIVPSKIGRFIPMADIEIKNESELKKDMPDYLIIGAWNYLNSAKEKLKWYTEAGGKLINPLNCEIIDK